MLSLERMSVDVQRWAAFSADPAGGNPAGVVLDARGLDDAAMLRIAGEVGYAETAFVVPGDGPGNEPGDAPGRFGIRYFSPHAEVPFCGHATVATAVALAERGQAGPGERGRIVFATPVGDVAIETVVIDGRAEASFTSVEPSVSPLDGAALADVLGVLGVGPDALDPAFAPAVAFAGNPHPLVLIADRAVFDGLAPDAARARAVLDAHGWPATIGVLWRETADRWHVRHVFPVGSIIEDPATGSAAAATGGWLRAIGAVAPPAELTILQGAHVGRPGELRVRIPETGGIVVTGTAVRIG